MHRKIAAFSLMAVLGAAAGSAQEIRTAPKEITAPDYNTVNCSGFVTDQKFPQEFRVISGVQSKVSIAQVIFSCDYMQRGDVVLPYQERPVPPLKEAAAFDHFAPVSGKPVAMVVTGKDHQDTFGKNSAVYVNLGTNQGVKVGDYFRIFRYQGSTAETVPQTKDYQFTMYGFGSAPQRYIWNDLPREVLGEGIVFHVSHNSSTMMITVSSSEIYAGDYIEIE